MEPLAKIEKSSKDNGVADWHMISHNRIFGWIYTLPVREETPICSEARTLKVTVGFAIISSTAAATLKFVTK